MASMTFASWWAAMKAHHAVLGVVYFRGVIGSKEQSFTLMERILFLMMAVGAAWFGVSLQYFYLRRWVPVMFSEIADELQLFPSTWAEEHIDSVLCSALGGMTDLFLGKELVRTVLKKDWESKAGIRGFVSMLATSYAIVLTNFAILHAAAIFVAKPDLQLKLFVKFASCVVLKLAFVETAMVTAKTFIASRCAEGKGKKA
mmetsp:Transcript_27365/g.76069  ORF Transcript_27365/g.76069 Transcript_27365/m.76069 type:complete len:201 (+) Transcript_27365:84-686(+)